MAFTVKSVAQAKEMWERAQGKMERLREQAESAIGTGIQMAEVSGAAFGFGYANGRWGENGELAIGGVPVDLGAAVVLHGTAFLGGFGKYSEHGHNLGTGALAACAYRTGAQIGASAAQKAHGHPQNAALAWQQPPPWMLGPSTPAPQTTESPAMPVPVPRENP